ncbi:transposase family protein [Streptomyces canus]|uniref:transposase family protein n=1 Tax=Streptomyces canus TaxID=58343 RepID=UPI0036C2655F
MSSQWARAALSHSAFTGLSRAHLGNLIEELAGPWAAQRESRLHERRHGERLRAAGAGRRHGLVFVDRVLVALAHLRLDLTHAALAELFDVDRCTVTKAIGQIRPLLAARGFATPTGFRLRILADVFAYAQAEGVRLRLDGTEIQVRRPAAHRPGRRRFVSGKRRQNTHKCTVASDSEGRPLWVGAHRPGRMHDQTALKTEGIEDLLGQFPQVELSLDSGYQGLAKLDPKRIVVPPPKPGQAASADEITVYQRARRHQSSERICVEHAIAEIKTWRVLKRYHGRREHLNQTIDAVASLASDRAARR